MRVNPYLSDGENYAAYWACLAVQTGGCQLQAFQMQPVDISGQLPIIRVTSPIGALTNLPIRALESYIRRPVETVRRSLLRRISIRYLHMRCILYARFRLCSAFKSLCRWCVAGHCIFLLKLPRRYLACTRRQPSQIRRRMGLCRWLLRSSEPHHKFMCLSYGLRPDRDFERRMD